MQKVVCTLAIVLTGFSATIAQTEKGRWTAGVSVGSFNYQRNGDNRSFSANLTPSAGYFVVTNLLVGTGVPLGFATAKSGNYYQSNSSSIGLSPFMRYYFGGSNLKPYVGVSYSYLRSSSRIQRLGAINESASTALYSSVAPSVGLAYFINRNVALNTGLSYNFQYSTFRSEAPTPTGSATSESKSDYRSLSLGIGFGLFFGN